MEPLSNETEQGADRGRARSPGAAVGIWSTAKFGIIAEIELRALWSTKSTLVGQLLVSPLVYTALLAAGLKGLIAPGAAGERGASYLTFAFWACRSSAAAREPSTGRRWTGAGRCWR